WNAGGKNGRGYLFYAGVLEASMAAGSAAATVTGDAAGRQLGMWGRDDINHDGYSDLLGYESLENYTGRQYLFYGAAGDAPISGGLISNQAANTFSGVEDNEFFELVGTDDVNGDGYADIVARSRCGGDVGCVYAFLGPDFAAQETSATADVTITGAAAGDFFGGTESNVCVADVNGDGIADIIAGSPVASAQSGLIQVFYGGPSLASKSASAADVTITGDGDLFGSYPFAADLDGDGRKDIVVPNYNYDSSRGRVYVFYGANLASKGAADADVILTGENVGDDFSAVETGDVNGDGLTDLLVGADGYDTDRGRAYVFYGGSGIATKGAADANIIYTGNAGDSLEVAPPADINGDGIEDIILPRSYSASAQGKIFIFIGGSGMTSGTVDSANITLSGEGTTDGYRFIRTLDVNGDGIADVIAGASRYDSDRGRAYIFYGDVALSSRTADLADVIITGESANDQFGLF
ncbi:MAG: VCBS repeat-containing protein, partial [Proteobacteria bacterium]|nr:VCBS repeat-containing protein [Pseudomonadota bacterium]